MSCNNLELCYLFPQKIYIYFSNNLNTFFVYDGMTQRRTHFHRELNASASEDQVKPEDFLDFRTDFKRRKQFQKKPFLQTRNEELFFFICRIFMRKRFFTFNAFVGDFLILVLNQVNVSKSAKLAGSASVEETFLIFSRG
jgi:hypothetical protein